MTLLSAELNKESNPKGYWSRGEATEKMANFEENHGKNSQRGWSKREQVPRTTLQYWLKRKKTIDSSPNVVQFFESPDGLAFLHRLVIAIHFVFTKVGVASIHNISEFLKLSGLSPFMGSSYGSQQKMSESMDELCVQFSKEETHHLSATMPAKRVTVCEADGRPDETYHPEICMVAIEPISNYIFVEKYVQDAKGATWNEVLSEALSGLPIQLIQSTSDEGAGLLNHVTNGLNIYHSPDLFHVSYEITKGTSCPLSAKVNQAEKDCLKKEELVQKAHQKKEKAFEKNSDASEGYFQLFDQTIEKTSQNLKQTQEDLKQAQTNRETARKMKRKIGKSYHPYNLITGAIQKEKQVESQIKHCFEEINKATEDLSQTCQKHIKKAFRVVDKMTATIAFFFRAIDMIVEDCPLSPDLKKLMQNYAIPGFYLEQAALKEKNPEERYLINQKSKELLVHFKERSSPVKGVDPDKQKYMEKTAKQCAQIFQRSSSCVELGWHSREKRAVGFKAPRDPPTQ